MKYAKVLTVGNLLLSWNSERQINRTLKLQTMEKAIMTKIMKVEEYKAGCKGVIYGIPLGVDMEELVKKLKERCDSVLGAKRLTRGINKIKNCVYSEPGQVFQIPKVGTYSETVQSGKKICKM